MGNKHLKNGRQVVVVGGSSSCELSVNHSVRQSSMHGSLLFLLLVNDFSSLDGALLYADVTTLKTGSATVVKLKKQHLAVA